MSIVETCHQLSSRKVEAQSVINWAVVGQLRRDIAIFVIFKMAAAAILNFQKFKILTVDPL